MTWTISQRAQKLTSSAIREILKVTERPEVISFAGGLPSAATFPVARIRSACDSILTSAPSPALQYGPTEGYKPLREWVVQRHSREGVSINIDQVLITMQLLDKAIAEEKIAFIPGAPFFANAPQHNTMRLSFVTVPKDKIRYGMARLGTLIARECER